MPTDSTSEARIDFIAPDGTTLAVWRDGGGPPLVLVHGSLQDHSANRSFVDELVGDFTTFAIDRRGFGASGDSDGWSIGHDFDDLTAVIDVIADDVGEPVSVWGHSFGANVAMGAAAATANVRALVLYEPSLGLSFPDGAIDSLEARVESGDREGAVGRYLLDVLHLEPDDIDALRSTPRWATMVASVHTVARESRAEQGWSFEGQFDAITAPALFLTGSETPPDIKLATEAALDAIGPAEVRVLDGHGHLAHRSDPRLVAGLVRDFLS